MSTLVSVTLGVMVPNVPLVSLEQRDDADPISVFDEVLLFRNRLLDLPRENAGELPFASGCRVPSR
jgi:hypothetical protein